MQTNVGKICGFAKDGKIEAMKNILPVLADIANGIFAVLIVAWILSIEPLWWHFIVGIAFAMSPDIDALPELFQRGH